MTYESTAALDTRIDIGAVLSAIVSRLPRIIVLTLVLLAATFVLLMFVPRQYESSASILVESRSNVYTRAPNEQAPSLTGGEPGVVSSQIALIKSRDTLMRVIDEQGLRSVPEFNGGDGSGYSPMALISQLLGRKTTPTSIDETVLKNLYDKLTVSQERDSRLFSVQVLSTDPQRAADIANAIASAHVARRAQLSLSDTADASGWLRDEIARLEVVVKDAETAVANYKVNNDLFTGANNGSLLDQQLSTIAGQISAAQERKNTAASRAQLIRGMLERGQSIAGVADVRDSVVIQRLSEEKARLQGEKAQRSATLLASHPTIRALTAQIDELDSQIALEGRRVANALDAEAQIESDLEASLKANLSSAKVSASTATQDTVTLDALQRDAKAQRDLLESYLQRYNEASSRTETNSALPDVRVVSVAAPSVSPASPKTSMILVAVGVVALFAQIGLVVFLEMVSGRAIIAIQPYQGSQDELEEVPFNEAELEPDQRYEVASDTGSTNFDTEIGDDNEFTLADTRHDSDVLEPIVDEPLVGGPALEFEPDVASESTRATRSVAADFISALVAESTLERTQPAVAPAPAEAIPDLLSMSTLAADVGLGRTHLVLLAAHRRHAECEAVAEELVAEALGRGLSVALVDAGSARISEELGLSDLSGDVASFGDVVHKSADNSFAEIPWGRTPSLQRQSKKPVTLVEALGDIYEVVVLLTGRVGMNSTLPMFAGMNGRVVLVADVEDDSDAVADSRAQLLEAGFKTVEVARGPARVAA